MKFYRKAKFRKEERIFLFINWSLLEERWILPISFSSFFYVWHFCTTMLLFIYPFYWLSLTRLPIFTSIFTLLLYPFFLLLYFNYTFIVVLFHYILLSQYNCSISMKIPMLRLVISCNFASPSSFIKKQVFSPVWQGWDFLLLLIVVLLNNCYTISNKGSTIKYVTKSRS